MIPGTSGIRARRLSAAGRIKANSNTPELLESGPVGRIAEPCTGGLRPVVTRMLPMFWAVNSRDGNGSFAGAVLPLSAATPAA
jgi:hypothetical protein